MLSVTAGVGSIVAGLGMVLHYLFVVFQKEYFGVNELLKGHKC